MIFVLCNQCEKTFKLAKDLEFHVKNVHKKKKTYCDECGEVFKMIQDLQIHMKSVHKGWKCDQCGKRMNI